MSNSFQGDSQSGLDTTSRSHRGWGIWVCCLAASTSLKNTCRRLRERASAWVFSLPRMCLTYNAMSKCAQMKCKQRRRCITVGSLLVSVSRKWTTATLLHQACTWQWAQYCPHSAHAITIRRSSCAVIPTDCHASRQGA